MQFTVFKIIIRSKNEYGVHKGNKVQDGICSSSFNFKTKKVEFGEEMTAEIILNDL